jgi:hypothetical protein
LEGGWKWHDFQLTSRLCGGFGCRAFEGVPPLPPPVGIYLL